MLRYLLPGFLLLAILSCGVSDDASAVGQGQSNKNVTPSNQLFTLEDFGAIGFKVAKEYNVDGLTSATGAWFGFWRPEGSDAKEFEFRFYASHEDAVLYGTSFADEATGEGAVLEEEDATWKEGIKGSQILFRRPHRVARKRQRTAQIWRLCHLRQYGPAVRRSERHPLAGALFVVDQRSTFSGKLVNDI